MAKRCSGWFGCYCFCYMYCAAALGCLIAGFVYYFVKYDPQQRAEQIDAYNNAFNLWTASASIMGSAAGFASLGGFTVVGDYSVNLNVTSAAIEAPSVEQGTGIDAYTTRAAFTTQQNLFQPNFYVSGTTTKSATVYDAQGNALFSRSIALEKMITFSADQSCTTTGTGSNKHTVCTWSCSQGSLQGTTCYNYLYPSTYGVCFVIDPQTKQYVGGCAVMSPDAASLLDSSITPNRLGDIAWAYAEYPQSPVPWYNYPVTIRSKYDPWVVAAQETEGWLVFGIVALNYRKEGIVLMSVGGGMLGVPILCLLFLACVAIRECCSSCHMPSLPDMPRPSFTQRVSSRALRTATFGRYGRQPEYSALPAANSTLIVVGGAPVGSVPVAMPVKAGIMEAASAPGADYQALPQGPTTATATAPYAYPSGPYGTMPAVNSQAPGTSTVTGYGYGYAPVIVTPTPAASAPSEEDPIGPVPSKRKIGL